MGVKRLLLKFSMPISSQNSLRNASLVMQFVHFRDWLYLLDRLTINLNQVRERLF